MVVVVYLFAALTALEMQERWSLELVEEEKRAVIDRMMVSMTQRCRNGGFLAEIQPKMESEKPKLLEFAKDVLRRVVVCSAAASGFTEDTLREMINEMHAFGKAVGFDNVSGHFLYVPPFLSIVLEGPSAVIVQAFDQLWHHAAHHTISVIWDGRVKRRMFAELGVLRPTTIHPYQGFKGSVVVGIFQNLGHQHLTKTLYSPHSTDVPANTVRDVVVFVVIFSHQPENFALVSDSVLGQIIADGGEVLFASVNRFVCAFPPGYDVAPLGREIVGSACKLLSDCRFAAAKGQIIRCNTVSRLHCGTPVNRSMDLAYQARSLGVVGILDGTMAENCALADIAVESVAGGPAYLLSPHAPEDVATIPLITGTVNDTASSALVRMTYLSAPQSNDIAVATYELIQSFPYHVTDKMILVKSQSSRLVLHLLEGTLSELNEVFESIKKMPKHKYCFLAGVAEIKARIFTTEFEPLQVVSGDNWCPVLKLQIKVMQKYNPFIPGILRKLAQLNVSPASIGMIPTAEQVYAAFVPVANDLQRLSSCYRLIASASAGPWVDVVEMNQRVVLCCKVEHAVRLIHLAVSVAQLVKRMGQCWVAIGLATGEGLNGHVGKQYPIFFMSGPAAERSWEMAVRVIAKPNAFGSSMLLCPITAKLARQQNPTDPIIGIGSNGLHHLPVWGLYSVDHPHVDMPTRSSSSTYFLCPRPLARAVPMVMQDDYDDAADTPMLLPADAPYPTEATRRVVATPG
eukprot:TRINITY_DN21269_c0_g1_i1.p1 TRINITY_DN21269_c0_g1~~TRINITY_DN21269_c0_g1_i1.p1  ORF type:complete len:838 (+),score=292.15 TRINITY_DN21269_c0_g1_i1:290-2515(+)